MGPFFVATPRSDRDQRFRPKGRLYGHYSDTEVPPTPDADGIVPEAIFEHHNNIGSSDMTTSTCTSTYSKPCSVHAQSAELANKLWFRTPALDEPLIKKIHKIQLQTTGHDQGFVDCPSDGSWSWFDLLILDSVDAREPEVKDGLALLWTSHTNTLGGKKEATLSGRIFDRAHDLFEALKPGNCLAVRVCARFQAWSNYATEAILTLHLSEKDEDPPSPRSESIDALNEINAYYVRLVRSVSGYLHLATPDGAPPAYSVVQPLQGPLRADIKAKGLENEPLQLLSLDGGGIRGISSLYILQAIIDKLNPEAKPADYFHMIAGTSTGGLIAIMLGRLRMTVQECIEAYTRLASEIFAGTDLQKVVNWATTGARYEAKNFEKSLKSFVKEQLKTNNGDTLLLDEGSNKCKVFVVSVYDTKAAPAIEHFRSYPTKLPQRCPKVKIWEAARATSAAPTYFPSITIEETEFIDGGLKSNNPTALLIGEATNGFPSGRLPSCIVSIGTGTPPKPASEIRRPKIKSICYGIQSLISLFEMTLKIVTDCETVHSQIDEDWDDTETYWRLNTDGEIDSEQQRLIALDDHKQMDKLVELTKDYLDKKETKERIAACASQLKRIDP